MFLFGNVFCVIVSMFWLVVGLYCVLMLMSGMFVWCIKLLFILLIGLLLVVLSFVYRCGGVLLLNLYLFRQFCSFLCMVFLLMQFLIICRIWLFLLQVKWLRKFIELVLFKLCCIGIEVGCRLSVQMCCLIVVQLVYVLFWNFGCSVILVMFLNQLVKDLFNQMLFYQFSVIRFLNYWCVSLCDIIMNECVLFIEWMVVGVLLGGISIWLVNLKMVFQFFMLLKLVFLLLQLLLVMMVFILLNGSGIWKQLQQWFSVFFVNCMLVIVECVLLGGIYQCRCMLLLLSGLVNWFFRMLNLLLLKNSRYVGIDGVLVNDIC